MNNHRIFRIGAAALLSLSLLTACGSKAPSSSTAASSAAPASSSAVVSNNSATNSYEAIPLPDEMRAMWVSFLEWEQRDLSSKESLLAALTPILDNSVAMGMNTIIVAVRPFGDALYKSNVFPWSHLLTGTQGQDPGYDPLSVIIEECHARGLRIEAWLNPYRIKGASNGPSTLSQDNPASLHPEWVRDVGGGLFYDPALPEVEQMLVDGVTEIVQNYNVDGINFDDYFYPDGHDDSFDSETYAQYGNGTSLADWRRQNVNTLMSAVYSAIKTANPTVCFGVSPQGNNDNNYNGQFSDVNLWLSTPGYADYVMPQLYWGFGYLTASGRDDAAFANKCLEWAGYSRHASIKLYAALGAYRIGDGDGGTGDQAEWSNGHNLADMVAHMRTVEGIDGFSLFRYDFLYQNDTYPELAANEVSALTAIMH